MFNKTIFKQSVKANWGLWAIFTVILTALLCLIAGVHDASASNSMLEVLEGMGAGESIGDKLQSMTSLLGVLSQTMFGMLAMILVMVYIIIIANSLVASEVDRGAMAYTLSTPVKRSTVIFTKGLYLLASLVLMIVVMMAAGTLTIQLKFGYFGGEQYTADVIGAAKALDMDRSEVAGNLTLILENEEALEKGASERGLDVDEYSAYLSARMEQDAYEAAAEVLGVTADEVENDISLIKTDDEALLAAAAVMGMTSEEYAAVIDQTLAQTEMIAVMQEALEEKVTVGLTAAAEVLDTDLSSLVTDMGQIKADSEAMEAACAASGLDEATFTSIINASVAQIELSKDEGEDFSVQAWLMLGVGLFLLMFAISGISFFASCMFNLTKYSLMLGAGLPMVFYILNLMGDISDSLSVCKYFTINSLYDMDAIIAGEGYGVRLAILAVIGALLYTAGIVVFKKKDLPL